MMMMEKIEIMALVFIWIIFKFVEIQLCQNSRIAAFLDGVADLQR